MRNRFLVVLAVTGVLAPTAGSALAAQDSSTGGTSPTPTKSKTSSKRKRVKLPKILKKIAICESGGNPRAVSRSGRYRGKYQFDMDTWRSVGGHGDPIDASEYQQDKRALKLYKKRGTAPWPHCAEWARTHGG
jgi:hypothetical protein